MAERFPFCYHLIQKIFNGGTDMSILEVNELKKIYTSRFGGNKVEALKNVSFCMD